MVFADTSTLIELLLRMKALGKYVDRLYRSSNMIVLTDEDDVQEIKENEKMGTQHTAGQTLSGSKCTENLSNSEDSDVCVVGEVIPHEIIKKNPRGIVLGPPRLYDSSALHIDKLKRLRRPGCNKMIHVGAVRRYFNAKHSLRNIHVPSMMRKNVFQMDEVVRLDEKRIYMELIQKMFDAGVVTTHNIRHYLLNFAYQTLQTFQPFLPIPHIVQIPPTLHTPSTSPRSITSQQPPDVEYVEYVDLTSELDDNDVVKVPLESVSYANDDIGARLSACVDNVIDLEQEPKASCSLSLTSSQQEHEHEEIQYISSTSSESEAHTNVEEIDDICVNEEEEEDPQYNSDIPSSPQNELKGNLSEQMLQQMIINDCKSNKEQRLSEDDIAVSLPEITVEMQELVLKAFTCRSNRVLVEAFNVTIFPRDILTLKGNNWLNDEVINFYVCLLMERGKLSSYPSVYCFNTFFYVKLVSSGHASLKRWTQKVDVFSYDLLIVPVHLKVHWCLACINFIEKRIEYYDSMYGKNDECGETLLQYLKDEYLDKKNKTFKTSGWEVVNVEDIPEQLNGCDCGVFVCTYAEYICRLAKLTFTQREMPYFRVKMAYEIITQKLML